MQNSRASHHFSRVNLGHDCLHRPAIVQAFKIHEQEPTRQLHFHRRGDKFRGWFPWSVLEI